MASETERTADGSAKKRERGGGDGGREALRARKSEEFWKMKRIRIRHQQMSRVERR